MHEPGAAVGRKTSVEPIPEDTALGTQVVILATTVRAKAADNDRRFARNPVAEFDLVFEIGSDLYHDATELVTHHHRGADGIVYSIVVDMDVRSTDTGGFYFHPDLIGGKRRLLYIAVIDETVAASMFDDPLQKRPTTDPRHP